MKIIKMLTLLSCLVFLSTAQSQSGNVYIDVGRAKIKKSTLAIAPLKYFGSDAANKSKIRIGQELYEVIKNNMDVSNFFTIQSPSAFLENTKKAGLKPAPGSPGGFKFDDWKSIGTEFLIKTGYKVSGSSLTMDVYVYSIPQVKLILGKSYSGSTANVRKVAHIFSDDLIKALTGKRGMFNTKFVVTANRDGRYKEIYTMDWDAKNIKRITKFRGLSISPAWSHDGKQIAFTNWAYHKRAKTRNADLFLYKLTTGKMLLLSHKKGINSGAAFHPNGRDLFFTISRSGTPDIYKMNLTNERLTPLIRGPRSAMNVEPAISPDGTKLAFSSDRSGRPMIYISNIYGGAVKRITFAGKYNASPSWAPDNRTLVFAGYDKSHFDIFTVDTVTKKITRLTSAKKRNGRWADNEAPSFSPDGRHIVFTSNRTGKNQLYLISPDGRNERRITKDSFHYEKPKWSPFLN